MAICNHNDIKHPDCPWCNITTLEDCRLMAQTLAEELLKYQDPFSWRGKWHVRHADGSEEEIVLEHGNLVEDNTGSVGQFLLHFSEDLAVRGAEVNKRLGRTPALGWVTGDVVRRNGVWTHIDADGVSTGEARDIRLTPNSGPNQGNIVTGLDGPNAKRLREGQGPEAEPCG